MRILMIAPQPFFQSRGTPFSVYFRTRTLAAMGYQVDVITYPIGRDVAIPGVKIYRSASVPFINKIKIGPSFPKLILDIPLFFKGFWMLLTNKYDYVHAHEEGMFFCLFYKVFFWRMKIIYDMHSSLPQQLRNFKFTQSRFLIGIFEAFENASLRLASGIITICPDLRDTVKAAKVKVPSVMIENTLFDRVDFAEDGDDVGENLIDWKKFEGKKVILYSGTFEAYQGLPMLVEGIPTVLAKRPDAMFLLIGGTPQQVSDVRTQAAALNVKSAVTLTGNLPPNAIKAFLKRADVLVSPRMKGTNSPLKIYEYLASGKPIVATRHPTHTQILTDKEAVLAGCDAVSFAEGILQALNLPERSSQVVRGADELYRTAYNPDLYRARLTELFERMGANAGAR